MMKVIRERIGETDVLIQAMDDRLEGLNVPVDTGIEDDIQDAYAKAKTVIKNMAKDLGNDLNKFREESGVKQMEVEFSLGFSAQTKVWVIGVKADSVLKVKLIW
ncbi:MAG: CU044_2847 family protein [Candidatus Electrothrix sp. GW3-4]|uniref:CU044_2847 family protein n=1 Tax=Candidatus Electrothrix sp. GW3-4 TaxID=3126740 RepID=UPI0030D04110